LVAVDWDRDLDIDILLSGPNDTPAGWLENLRHGALRWRTFEGKLADVTGSSRLNLAEVDGNGSWDIVATGPKGAVLALTKTVSPGQVEPLDLVEFSNDPLTDCLIGDFDNDTHPDLIASGKSGLQLFQGTPSAGYKPAGNVMPPDGKAVACSAADLDGDGDLDLVIAEADRLVLYDNEGGHQNHWLAVRAQGESGDNQNTGDVNHLGIGSLLELKTGRQYQAQLVTGHGDWTFAFGATEVGIVHADVVETVVAHAPTCMTSCAISLPVEQDETPNCSCRYSLFVALDPTVERRVARDDRPFVSGNGGRDTVERNGLPRKGA
jgi:hypothetical protein